MDEGRSFLLGKEGCLGVDATLMGGGWRGRCFCDLESAFVSFGGNHE